MATTMFASIDLSTALFIGLMAMIFGWPALKLAQWLLEHTIIIIGVVALALIVYAITLFA